jgi:hypothetical protein
MIVPQSLASGFAEPPFGRRETAMAPPSFKGRNLPRPGANKVGEGEPTTSGHHPALTDSGYWILDSEFRPKNSKLPVLLGKNLRLLTATYACCNLLKGFAPPRGGGGVIR